MIQIAMMTQTVLNLSTLATSLTMFLPITVPKKYFEVLLHPNTGEVI